MTKALKDPFARMLEKKTDVPFFAAQAYAAVQCSPTWMVEYLSLRAHEGTATSYVGIPAGILEGGPEAIAGTGRLMEEVVRAMRDRLAAAEKVGRNLFRQAIADGRLHVFADYPGDRLGAETNEFRSVRLELPSDSQWVESNRGGVAVVGGFASNTYLDRYQFLEWLEEVLPLANGCGTSGKHSPVPKKQKQSRSRGETKLTLKLLAAEYGEPNTIGADTPGRAAERIVDKAFQVGRIKAGVSTETGTKSLAQHIWRLQKDGIIAEYTHPAFFGEP